MHHAERFLQDGLATRTPAIRLAGSV